MTTPRFLAVPLMLLGLASSAASQQRMCIRGLVEQTAPFSICPAGQTHQFTCNGLLLRPEPGVNLVALEGQIAELCGVVAVVPPTCVMMRVDTARAPVDGLTVTGPTNRQIPPGGLLTFDLGRTPGLFYVLLLSAGSARTDLGPPGVLLLDPPLFVLGSGVLDAAGSASFQARVPNDPALLRTNLFFQPAFVDLSSLAPALANSECVQVL